MPNLTPRTPEAHEVSLNRSGKYRAASRMCLPGGHRAGIGAGTGPQKIGFCGAPVARITVIR